MESSTSDQAIAMISPLNSWHYKAKQDAGRHWFIVSSSGLRERYRSILTTVTTTSHAMIPKDDSLIEFFDITRAAEAAARWPLLTTLWSALGGEGLAPLVSRGTKLHVSPPTHTELTFGRKAEVRSPAGTVPAPSSKVAGHVVGDDSSTPVPQLTPTPAPSPTPSLEELFDRLR